MSKTKIEWTEATWNPSIGCTKKSEGCKNCYAEAMAKRLQAMGIEEYKNGFKFRIIPDRLRIPLETRKPTKFFVNSMSDLFHEDMPMEFLNQIFEVIKETPQHTYQILTKRSKNMENYFKNKNIPQNVWLGVTVESSKQKDRIDSIRNIEAKIKFISAEPLIGDLGEINLKNIDWIIVGGESGLRARPMKEEWVINVKNQAKEQDVAFFFKQWGTWGMDGVRRNKKANGRKLLNKIWEEYPAKMLVSPRGLGF